MVNYVLVSAASYIPFLEIHGAHHHIKGSEKDLLFIRYLQYSQKHTLRNAVLRQYLTKSNYGNKTDSSVV